LFGEIFIEIDVNFVENSDYCFSYLGLNIILCLIVFVVDDWGLQEDTVSLSFIGGITSMDGMATAVPVLKVVGLICYLLYHFLEYIILEFYQSLFVTK